MTTERGVSRIDPRQSERKGAMAVLVRGMSTEPLSAVQKRILGLDFQAAVEQLIQELGLRLVPCQGSYSRCGVLMWRT